ncbi:DUF5675 family protein [candidate division KSB1 bacterium]
MRPIVELVRLEENYSYGTFGALKINKQVFCVTLEPHDELNARRISSIPAQQYLCRRHHSQRFGETFRIMDVPGRDGVLLHPGNIQSDTEGCVLLAEHYGKLKGKRGVLNSGKTFRAFMALMDGIDEFHLTVQEHY